MAKVSHLKLSDDFHGQNKTVVPISPFIPSSANLFHKMPDRLSEPAWETWFFDGVSSNGKNGLAIDFFRGGGAKKAAMFRVSVPQPFDNIELY